MKGIIPDQVDHRRRGWRVGPRHTIYLWTAPLKKEQAEEARKPDVIYVPTPQEVVEKMLEVAKVTKDDVVYDLGCGDGRIPVTAAKKYGCKAFGFDIDPERIKESQENVEKNKVGNLVTIEQKDIFTLDLSKANVVTLYLLPSLNVKLIPQLEKLKPGLADRLARFRHERGHAGPGHRRGRGRRLEPGPHDLPVDDSAEEGAACGSPQAGRHLRAHAAGGGGQDAGAGQGRRRTTWSTTWAAATAAFR